jgi:hypothetical protein
MGKTKRPVEFCPAAFVNFGSHRGHTAQLSLKANDRNGSRVSDCESRVGE